MDLSEIESAMEKYYKMKSKYEDKVRKSRQTIINSDLSKKKKKLKLKSMKKNCINCKKDGGTIFSNKNRVLSAKCGNKESPCSLDIQIRKPNIITLQDALVMTDEQLELNKEAIINLKLDILFGLKAEEEIIDTFQEERNNYKMNMKQKESLENVIGVAYEKDYTNEETGEEKTISMKQYLRIKNNEMNKHIDSFKEKITEYMEEEDVSSKNTSLKSAIKIYIEQIIPLMKQMRESKYDISTIIKEDGKFIVKNIKELHIKNEYPIDTGEIISNKK
jgi:hypothetical protein